MTTDERLAILKAEILRWNDQINLVSRVRSRRVVDDQVIQCRRGWTLLAGDQAANPTFDDAEFIDIGSGAGLPGLVWAAERIQRSGAPVRLVEPREKRAWFLRRTARLMGLDTVAVEARRWAGVEDGVGGIEARAVSVSMKALRVDDAAVLGGLASIPGGGRVERVTIARFMPPAPGRAEDLGDEMVGDMMVEGVMVEDVGSSRRPWVRDSVRLVGAGEPSLLLVDYRRGDRG
jgi:hypothetical protein